MLRDSALIPLSHQHQHGLALTVIIERGLKADATEEKARDLSQRVAAAAEAELFGHFKIEEEVVFPQVRPLLDSGEIIDDLIQQHRQMEKLIQQIAEAGEGERRPLLQEFGEVLRDHIRIEERQLFQEMQQKLSKQDMAGLGKQIDTNIKRICPITEKVGWLES